MGRRGPVHSGSRRRLKKRAKKGVFDNIGGRSGSVGGPVGGRWGWGRLGRVGGARVPWQTRRRRWAVASLVVAGRAVWCGLGYSGGRLRGGAASSAGDGGWDSSGGRLGCCSPRAGSGLGAVGMRFRLGDDPRGEAGCGSVGAGWEGFERAALFSGCGSPRGWLLSPAPAPKRRAPRGAGLGVVHVGRR